MQLSSPPLFKQGTPALLKLAGCLVVSLTLMVVDYQFKALGEVRSIVSYLLTPLQNVMLLPRGVIEGSYDYLTTKSSLEEQNELLVKRVAELTLLANQSEVDSYDFMSYWWKEQWQGHPLNTGNTCIYLPTLTK